MLNHNILCRATSILFNMFQSTSDDMWNFHFINWINSVARLRNGQTRVSNTQEYAQFSNYCKIMTWSTLCMLSHSLFSRHIKIFTCFKSILHDMWQLHFKIYIKKWILGVIRLWCGLPEFQPPKHIHPCTNTIPWQVQPFLHASWTKPHFNITST